jgi:hypothetical protein
LVVGVKLKVSSLGWYSNLETDNLYHQVETENVDIDDWLEWITAQVKNMNSSSKSQNIVT